MRKIEYKKPHPMPSLSALDQVIYLALLAAIIGSALSIMTAALSLQRELALSEAEVVAYTETAGRLWLIPGLLLLFLPLLCAWLHFYRRRKPIFGVKGFSYGPPKWPEEYPLFMRNKPASFATDQRKAKYRALAWKLALLCLVGLLCLPLSVSGRKCLYEDGGFRVYDALNRAGEKSSVEEIQRLEFGCKKQNVGKHGKMTAYVEITTADGKSARFYSTDFRKASSEEVASWLTQMQALKALCSSDRIEYSGEDRLDQIIQEQNLTSAEAAQLYDLFDMAYKSLPPRGTTSDR